MPQNLKSADKARLAQEARKRAALKQRRAGGRTRTRPARGPVSGSEASSSVEEVVATSSSFDQVSGVSAAYASTDSATSAQTASEADADALCELVVNNPTALGSFTPTVRMLCRNRRKMIAAHGKKAVAKTRTSAGNSTSNVMLASTLIDDNANSRDFARKRRSAISRMGRGNKPKSRPSRPPRPKYVPPKVEFGTTLSGSPVSGTQVERTETVTGNESGTCSPVTGTEYIGAEQFAAFCANKPEKPTPKVGASMTAAGSTVSGTEVGRSVKVSGDEQGACQAVTGTQYLGTERFADFCENKGVVKPVRKVIAGTTRKKQIAVTGSDEFRQNDTTGLEIGADRVITGSQYADASTDLSNYSSQRTVMPNRMERPEAPSGSGVTGSEYSSYDAVTGSDYSFSSPAFSYSRAEEVEAEAPDVPRKVGVDSSCAGQRITGNLVGRSSKVTGNEHGSDRHLTGSQYGRNSCTQPSKMPSTHAYAGGRLTGNRVAHDPKINGDGLSGCQPITGTEMHGLEPLKNHCSSTQAPVSAGFDNTPQAVASLPDVEPHAHDFTRAVPQQFIEPEANASHYQAEPVAPTTTRPQETVSYNPPPTQPVAEPQPVQPVQVQQEQMQIAKKVEDIPAPASQEVSSNGSCCSQCAAEKRAEQASQVNTVDNAQSGGACCSECAAQQRAEQQAQQASMTQASVTNTPSATSVSSSTSTMNPVQHTHTSVSASMHQHHHPAPAPAAPVVNEPSPPPVMEQVPVAHASASVPPVYVAQQHMGHAGQAMAHNNVQQPHQHHHDGVGVTTAQSMSNAGSMAVITGPNTMGVGLLSGTPEARYPQQMVQPTTTANVPVYQDHSQSHGHGHPQAQTHVLAPMASPPPVHVPQPQYAQPQYSYPDPNTHLAEPSAQQEFSSRRVTGEGREGGLPITGDNWTQGNQVTGTEGRWAQARNPTLQVDSRMVVSGARSNKGMERPVASHSTTPITGSSGSSEQGAQVTVSGGARG